MGTGRKITRSVKHVSKLFGNMAMKHFNLDPLGGWGKFSRNSELVDFIYEVCLEKVNKGGWCYINPISNVGIFEDENGNYLYLETYDKGDITLIYPI